MPRGSSGRSSTSPITGGEIRLQEVGTPVGDPGRYPPLSSKKVNHGLPVPAAPFSESTPQCRGGNSVIARSPRIGVYAPTMTFCPLCRFARRLHVLIASRHASAISPMNLPSHLQFERPRLERRQGNHRSLLAGRPHTWRGATPGGKWWDFNAQLSALPSRHGPSKSAFPGHVELLPTPIAVRDVLGILLWYMGMTRISTGAAGGFGGFPR